MLQSYEHYKGGTYTLLYIARNSSVKSELIAVYVSHQTQNVWVRPLVEFEETVRWPSGAMFPRFRRQDRIWGGHAR